MKILLALLVLPVFSLSEQVKHAPTVVQCQSDQKLWLTKIEKNSADLPAFEVLTDWQSEMKDCQTVDEPNNFKYYNTRAEITAEKLS